MGQTETKQKFETPCIETCLYLEPDCPDECRALALDLVTDLLFTPGTITLALQLRPELPWEDVWALEPSATAKSVIEDWDRLARSLRAHPLSNARVRMRITPRDTASVSHPWYGRLMAILQVPSGLPKSVLRPLCAYLAGSLMFGPPLQFELQYPDEEIRYNGNPYIEVTEQPGWITFRARERVVHPNLLKNTDKTLAATETAPLAVRMLDVVGTYGLLTKWETGEADRILVGWLVPQRRSPSRPPGLIWLEAGETPREWLYVASPRGIMQLWRRMREAYARHPATDAALVTVAARDVKGQLRTPNVWEGDFWDNVAWTLLLVLCVVSGASHPRRCRITFAKKRAVKPHAQYTQGAFKVVVSSPTELVWETLGKTSCSSGLELYTKQRSP